MRIRWVITILVSSCIVAIGWVAHAVPPQRIEEFFPPEVKYPVKQQPLTAQQRQYLKQFGVDDRTLDLFGGLYVRGFGADALRWGDMRPDDLGDRRITYDTSGMAKLPFLPPAGVHPRLFFTDAERDTHRHRLEQSRGGREARKILQAYTDLLKGTYDPTVDYAQPDVFKGGWGGVRGFLPLFREGGNIAVNRQIWEAYTEGRLPDCKPYHDINPGLCALEAYRCWVYHDTEGARKVARAMETAVRSELAKLPPGKLPEGRYFTYNLAFVYDFLYNELTPEQRALFHNALVAATFNSNQYGVFQHALNTTSNWATFSYLMLGWLALEGDPGFNKLQYLGYRRGLHNYFTYGWFKAGPCFEAFGKNQIGGDIVYPMARRGDNLAAHPHILATIRDYLPHAIVPWGNAYIAYDRWGGLKPLNPSDILPYKNLFPTDKRIDWVYRNTVRPDYSWKHGDVLRVEGYQNTALFAVLWTVDYDETNSDPGKLMASESFLDGQRGLVITRGDWTKDALYLHHHVRGQSGGHVFADRSSFVLGGRGRMWVPNPAIGYETRQNNVVMIDGTPLSPRAPARLADYHRTPLATFSTADLRDTVNFEYERLYILQGDKGLLTPDDARMGRFTLPEGWEREMKAFNDYALEQDTGSAQFTTPRFERPDWLAIGKVETAIRKRRQALAVTSAFRSIGMIRPTPGMQGEPYVLSIDDFATADGKPHTYDWQMRLAADLMVVQVQEYTVDKNGKPTESPVKGAPLFYDILLAPKEAISIDANEHRIVAQDSPVLLVRVLQVDGDVPETGPIIVGFADDTAQKLVIRTSAITPNFKVLLYPHRYRRSALPVTTWEPQRISLTVRIGTQVDRFTFATFTDARTIFTLTREDPEPLVFRYAGNEYASQPH